MRKHTRRRPAGRLRPRRLPRRPPPPAPRLPRSAPTRLSLSIFQRSGTSPNRGSYDMHSNPGATRLMHQHPSSTSTPPPPPTITCQSRESASQRSPSGRRVVATISRMLMVVATKDFRSPAGTTRMEHRAATSPCPTSVERSAGRPSPRLPVFPTTRTGSGTTHQSRCPAHPTRPQAPCPVSNTYYS
jgi:hypothetical protein